MKGQAKNLKLNLTGVINKKIELDYASSESLRRSNLKIGDFINPLAYGLDESLIYKISGGSTVSGTPARKYVLNYNPIKERVSSRKKALRVFNNRINLTWAVADILVTNKKSQKI